MQEKIFMKYIKNGKIIMPNGEIVGKVLAFSDKIVDVVDEKDIGRYGLLIGQAFAKQA